MRDARASKTATGDSAPAPVLQTQARCPSCGREAAIVFASPEAGERVVRQLVCLDCCPKPSGDS